MQRKPIHFYADGLRLDGDLYLPDGYRPDGPDGRCPQSSPPPATRV
jgi:hypothetical protein